VHDSPIMAKDLSGKNIVVTGANTGIGQATAEILARRGARVVLACRSEEKTRPVLEGIRAEGGEAAFLSLDLASLDSVRAAADALVAEGRAIDVLVNNAGLAGLRSQTKDGFEIAFGTNHLGHFLFTSRVLPLLRKASAPRIVNVSSKSHYEAKGIDWDALRAPTRTVTGLPEYAVSKLANVLFTAESARRLGPLGIRSYALHPGVVASDAWRQIPWPFRSIIKLFMISNEQGAATSIHCATSAEAASEDGRYYDSCREKKPSRLARDEALAKALWEKSCEWTGAEWPGTCGQA
jgi:NAD(P)-dependent dehydrogenase (short-subunit alcohol dehydrogenase family)